MTEHDAKYLDGVLLKELNLVYGNREAVRLMLVEICALHPKWMIEACVNRMLLKPWRSIHPTEIERSVALLVLNDGMTIKAVAKKTHHSAAYIVNQLRRFCRWANKDCFEAGEWKTQWGRPEYNFFDTHGPTLKYLKDHANEFLNKIGIVKQTLS